MKKIMGHLTGKLSLSILSVTVLLVGVLAGLNGITSMKAGGKSPSAASRSSQNGLASATQASYKVPAASNSVSAAPVVTKASAAQTHQAPHAPVVTSVPADKAPKPPITKEAAKEAMSKMPLTFEPNRGQIDSQVKYVARSMGYQVFMTGPASAVLKYRASERNAQKTDFLTMKLAGANTAAVGQALAPTGGVTNYILGNDPSKWLTDIPNYAKLRYDNVYSGIDVIYQGDNSRFRYDFQVNPGADPKSIQIAYDGGKGISLDKNGNAVVELGSGRMVASNPTIYQEYGGQKHTISGHYVLSASNTLSFEVGSYDKSQALVIDPSDTYAMYVGPGKGNGGGTSTGTNFNTVLTAVAMDNTGPYMAGFTGNLGWIGGTAGLVGVYAKANLDLTATASVTMIGATPATQNGTSFTAAYGIAAYGGVPYVVGVTNAGSNWPSVGALETAPVNLPNDHAFLVVGPGSPKLSTLLYGSGLDIATSVAVEQAGGAHPGRIHVTGATSSGATSPTGESSFLANLPMATGASQPLQAAQASSSGRFNAFYVVVDSGMKTVDYATLFGGYGRDVGNGVAVDPAGNGYIVGTSNSFGAGTVVGFNAGGVATEPAPNQFSFVTPQGGGCPVNPAVIFPTPVPPSTFIGTARPAQGVAIVNFTGSTEQIVGITVTDPGAGYNPATQASVPVAVLGCGGTSIRALVQNVSGGTSANNLPIPGDTLTITSPGTFYNPSAPPVITITGGSCTVEPTASAIVNTSTPFGIAWLVLDTPGTGCTSPPTVTIQAPPTVAGVAGQTATAIYTQGTMGIELDPSATVPANDHAFVAKFNPNASPNTVTPNPTNTNPGSLSYAVAIGGTVEEANGASGTCTVIGNVTDASNIPPAALESSGTTGVITPGNIPDFEINPPGI